jgi:hypothetical protein
LTKPFKLGGSYDENGVVIFVMTECNTENDDNIELHIADYYKHFPREGENNNSSVDTSVDDLDSGRRRWI